VPPRLGDLPAPLTRLIGREREVAAVADLVRQDGVRLVTLTGPGGVGKTRLALRVTEEIDDAFADGVGFVELASVRDPAHVLAALATVVGVQDLGRRPLRESLIRALSERDLLLVLDNCEHVLPAAPQIADLLTRCPRLQVLASSRAPLGVAGERLWPVSSLPLPPADDPGPDFGPAVELFVERAQAVVPEFRLSTANMATVVQICRNLEGLPLALELAAARMRLLSPGELLVRLNQRLSLLTGGTCDLPPRLRSLEDAIAWSYDLLSPAEQWLLRRLAVFVGGFTVEAAEAVTASDIPKPLAALQTLVDHSLVVRGVDEAGESRFVMLETIREFALLRLAASGEAEDAPTAHAAYFLEFAERADPLQMAPEQLVGFDRLEAALPNLRAALFFFQAQGDGERGLRLANAIEWFWTSRGYFREARHWFDTFLAMPHTPQTRLRSLIEAANIRHWQGDFESAEVYADESLAICRALGDDRFIMLALRKLGHIVLDRGNTDRAATLLAESGELLPSFGNPWDLAFATHLAGCLASAAGNDEEAFSRFAEAANAFRVIGDRDYVAAALGQQGAASLRAGDFPAAAAAYAESLELAGATRDQTWVAWAVVGAAHLAHAAGEPATAARLLGGAAAIREAIGEGRLPKTPLTDAVRATLGDRRFAEAWSLGMSLPTADIVAEARTTLGGKVGRERTQTSSPLEQRLTCTPRERDVLRLLVDGLSDKEIAAALGIARYTASNHVTAIREKLGVPSRAAAAALAVRDGLV
jgi:non-specific serine/threonine protein kinase